MVFSQEGTVWAGYEIPAFNYDYRSNDDKMSLLAELEAFYWNIGMDTHALVVPQFRSIEGYLENTKSLLCEELKEVGLKHVQAGIEQLKGKEVSQYHFYLFIRLKESNVQGSFIGKMKYAFKDFKRFLGDWSGVDTPEILEEEIEAYSLQEELAYSRVHDYLQARRISTQSIEWLIRQGFWRGIGEAPLRTDWQPAAEITEIEGKKAKRPQRDILTLTEGLFDDSSGRQLVVEQFKDGKPQKGYMSFITLSHFPDNSEFPGMEWIYCLQHLSFPVEVSMRTETMSFREALSKVKAKKKELKAEDEHAAESGQDTSLHILEGRQEANELETALTRDKFPLLKTSAVICVFANTESELHRRIQLVRDLYADINIQTEIPYGDQWRAFNEFIPGSRRYITDYVHNMEPATVAASMFGATRQLGDGEGFLIGQSYNLPVFLRHDRGPKDKKLSTTGSAAIIGAVGGGKSMFGNLLAMQALYRGAKVLVFDPKDERGHWPDYLPELKPLTRLVTLRAAEEDRGKLDPLAGGGNLAEAAETAKRILQFLARTEDGTYESIVIANAVDEAVANQPSMIKVLENLKNFVEEAPASRKERLEEVYEVLKYHASSGQGQLLFGDGTQKSIDLSKQLTILQVEDLQLPEESRTDFGRMGIALLMAISDFARRFSNQSSDQFKIVLFDEAWRLAKAREGQAILEELIRTGRSKNSAIYLISQNSKDLLGEEIRSNLGYRFVFRSRDRSEAEAACQILGIEPNENNLDLIRSLPSGTCLMADLENRVNEVQIQVVEERLFHAFDTRPGARKEIGV